MQYNESLQTITDLPTEDRSSSINILKLKKTSYGKWHNKLQFRSVMSRNRSCYGPTSTFRLRVDGRLYNRIPHTCRLGVLSGMTFLNPLLWASPSQIWQLWIAVLTATKIGSTLGWSTNCASTFVWVTLLIRLCSLNFTCQQPRTQ